MREIAVRAVAGLRDRRDFVALPYRLYAGDPRWAPPLRRDVRAMLDPRRNPFFEHGAAECFLARRGDRVVGRIAAAENRTHNEVHRDRVGFFGFFECEDDAEASAALLEASAAWLRGRGLRAMRGPMSFTINDECGLLVDGFGTRAVLMMPHTPPYYAHLVEASGFAKAKDLLAYQSIGDQLPQRLVEGVRLLQRRHGLTTRPIEMARFREEVHLIRRLFNEAWSRNWGFVPFSEREADHLVREFRPVVIADLVRFAMKDGEAVAFAAAVPDMNVALRANPSGRLFPGILRVLWAARRNTRLRVILLGALPAWQGRGVDALLYKEIWEEGYARGFRWAEAGWVVEDNHLMRNGLVRMGFEVYKSYRVYERPL
jgi:GNAT superfamily N-acetyltransferase